MKDRFAWVRFELLRYYPERILYPLSCIYVRAGEEVDFPADVIDVRGEHGPLRIVGEDPQELIHNRGSSLSNSIGCEDKKKTDAIYPSIEKEGLFIGRFEKG